MLCRQLSTGDVIVLRPNNRRKNLLFESIVLIVILVSSYSIKYNLHNCNSFIQFHFNGYLSPSVIL